MKIAVIGKGGREQALVETLAASPCKPELFTFPGSDAICRTATRIEADSFDALIQWMVDNRIDLCVAGEESYLVKEDGLANRCAAAGIPCWGPQKESAQLEASKEFAKNFLLRHNLPATGGASGSPIFNKDGEVVALLFSGNVHVKFQNGELVERTANAAQINFGVRVDMMEGMGKKVPFDEFIKL